MKKKKIMQQRERNGKREWVLLSAKIVLSLIACAVIVAVSGVLYWNYMLKLLGDPQETIITTIPSEIEAAVTEIEKIETVKPTSPEETWPKIISNHNITNIMLIGQNYREGEEHKLADTMILCSINREKRTLTLVSFLRDLYVPLPAYAGHSSGRNRINVCYHLGSAWTGTPEGGMEMLKLCVEQNFGIPIDHSIEVNFDAFVEIIDILGGVEVELTEAEARYMTKNVGYVGDFVAGHQTLNGTEALAYARIRKIDDDIHRTGRQRMLLTSLIEKSRHIGLLELHQLVKSVLPKITTDMKKEEITNYVWEFLPLISNLEIRSLTCPVDNSLLRGSYWDRKLDIGGIPSYVLECDRDKNRKYFAEYLGLQNM